MSNLNLASVAAVLATFGRGVVFRAPKWVPSDGVLIMTQLGVTEGDITITPNESVAGLTLPELTGPIPHEIDYIGENPKLDIPLYLADPALLTLVSPTGSEHAGRSRRGPVKEHTLMIVPESIFLTADGVGIIDSTHTVGFDGAGAWHFDGVALTAAQQRALDASFWLWRCFFERPTRRFRGGDGDNKKNIEQVAVMAMHHPDMPEGHHIYTTGDPFANGIDLNGMS